MKFSYIILLYFCFVSLIKASDLKLLMKFVTSAQNEKIPNDFKLIQKSKGMHIIGFSERKVKIGEEECFILPMSYPRKKIGREELKSTPLEGVKATLKIQKLNGKLKYLMLVSITTKISLQSKKQGFKAITYLYPIEGDLQKGKKQWVNLEEVFVKRETDNVNIVDIEVNQGKGNLLLSFEVL